MASKEFSFIQGFTYEKKRYSVWGRMIVKKSFIAGVKDEIFKFALEKAINQKIKEIGKNYLKEEDHEGLTNYLKENLPQMLKNNSYGQLIEKIKTVIIDRISGHG